MAEMKFTNALLREAVADAEAVRDLANEVAKISLEEKVTPSFTAMWERKLRAESAAEKPHEDGEAEGSSEMPADTSVIGSGDNKEPSDDASDTADTDKSGEAPADSKDDWFEDWSESDFDLDEVIAELEAENTVLEGEGAQKWTEANDGVLAEEEEVEDEEEEEEEEEGDEDEVPAEKEEDEDTGVYPVSEPAGDEEDDDTASTSDIGSKGPQKFTLDEFVAMMQEAGVDLAELTGAPALEEEGEPTLEDVMAEVEAEGAALEEDSVTEEMASEIQALQEELAEYRTAVEFLRGKLSEVNLLNAKLLYTNKLFRKPDLTNEQKVTIVENFDRASTVREVKLMYATIAETLSVQSAPAPAKRSAKKVVTEGFASKATPSTAPKADASAELISEGARRWQQLAGIIK